MEVNFRRPRAWRGKGPQVRGNRRTPPAGGGVKGTGDPVFRGFVRQFVSGVDGVPINGLIYVGSQAIEKNGWLDFEG